jgi:hypothetical protein
MSSCKKTGTRLYARVIQGPSLRLRVTLCCSQLGEEMVLPSFGCFARYRHCIMHRCITHHFELYKPSTRSVIEVFCHRHRCVQHLWNSIPSSAPQIVSYLQISCTPQEVAARDRFPNLLLLSFSTISFQVRFLAAILLNKGELTSLISILLEAIPGGLYESSELPSTTKAGSRHEPIADAPGY